MVLLWIVGGLILFLVLVGAGMLVTDILYYRRKERTDAKHGNHMY